MIYILLYLFNTFHAYNVSVNSKPDHPPPRAKPPGNFFDGRIPHPQAKKKFKTPTPWAYQNELKPNPRGIFLNYSP